jgi:hypothetical protein
VGYPEQVRAWLRRVGLDRFGVSRELRDPLELRIEQIQLVEELLARVSSPALLGM